MYCTQDYRLNWSVNMSCSPILVLCILHMIYSTTMGLITVASMLIFMLHWTDILACTVL